ncbi:hypothetical protein FRB99_002281 [Tulasnella sp. 403]|nr:hypothetical protein FRB99_002281 [Tulasnella sp. 403]
MSSREGTVPSGSRWQTPDFYISLPVLSDEAKANRVVFHASTRFGSSSPKRRSPSWSIYEPSSSATEPELLASPYEADLTNGPSASSSKPSPSILKEETTSPNSTSEYVPSARSSTAPSGSGRLFLSHIELPSLTIVHSNAQWRDLRDQYLARKKSERCYITTPDDKGKGRASTSHDSSEEAFVARALSIGPSTSHISRSTAASTPSGPPPLSLPAVGSKRIRASRSFLRSTKSQYPTDPEEPDSDGNVPIELDGGLYEPIDDGPPPKYTKKLNHRGRILSVFSFRQPKRSLVKLTEEEKAQLVERWCHMCHKKKFAMLCHGKSQGRACKSAFCDFCLAKYPLPFDPFSTFRCPRCTQECICLKCVQVNQPDKLRRPMQKGYPKLKLKLRKQAERDLASATTDSQESEASYRTPSGSPSDPSPALDVEDPSLPITSTSPKIAFGSFMLPPPDTQYSIYDTSMVPLPEPQSSPPPPDPSDSSLRASYFDILQAQEPGASPTGTTGSGSKSVDRTVEQGKRVTKARRKYGFLELDPHVAIPGHTWVGNTGMFGFEDDENHLSVQEDSGLAFDDVIDGTAFEKQAEEQGISLAQVQLANPPFLEVLSAPNSLPSMEEDAGAGDTTPEETITPVHDRRADDDMHAEPSPSTPIKYSHSNNAQDIPPLKAIIVHTPDRQAFIARALNAITHLSGGAVW